MYLWIQINLNILEISLSLLIFFVFFANGQDEHVVTIKVCPETGLYLDPVTGRGIDATTSQVMGKKKWRKTLQLAQKNKKKAVTYFIIM